MTFAVHNFLHDPYPSSIRLVLYELYKVHVKPRLQSTVNKARGTGGTAPSSLNLGTMVSFEPRPFYSPGERILVATGQEAGWAPVQV